MTNEGGDRLERLAMIDVHDIFSISERRAGALPTFGSWTATCCALKRTRGVLRYSPRARDTRDLCAFFEYARCHARVKSNSTHSIAVFLSDDETVFGRCLTIQADREGDPGMLRACVTIIDTRLNAQRVGHISDLIRCVDVDIPARIEDPPYSIFFGSVIDRQVDRVRAGLFSLSTEWGVAPDARPPDIATLFSHVVLGGVPPTKKNGGKSGAHKFARAVGIRRRSVIAFADIDDRTAVAVLDAEGIATVSDEIYCSVSYDRKRTIVVGQTTPRQEHGGETRGLLGEDLHRFGAIEVHVGVPLALVASTYLTRVYLEAIRSAANPMRDDDFVAAPPPDTDLMRREYELRSRRADARDTLRRILSRTGMIERVLQRAWRPDGRLAKALAPRWRDNLNGCDVVMSSANT